jgi:ectoine hydroxylase-related dioxygenase (phytanoyl-CoA dioxygenase family)
LPAEPKLDEDGYCIIPNVFNPSEVSSLRSRIETATTEDAESALRSRGTIFAARNLIDSIPNITQLASHPALHSILAQTLGANFGLVRALYFDKPSDRSWNLPFHKDLTIAVKDNSLPTSVFSKPTHKAGVDHVEASESLLENMLTLRIHLDNVTESNGPLEVIPGSHLTGKQNEESSRAPIKVLVNAGDVLAMRPMISHASGHTAPEGNLRRRILHLEYCGTETLPDDYRWMHFLSG